MKKITLGLSLLSALVSANTLSAPTANIKVTGDIKPPTCTVNGLTQNDILFDLGNISSSLIPQSEPYLYPRGIAENTVNIECDADTYLTFNATDTYASSSLTLPDIITGNKAPVVFHLVDAKDTTKSVGGIFFFWKNVKVDGKEAFISSSNDANSDAYTGNNILVTEVTNGWTNTQQFKVDKNSLDLVAGKLFSATFATPTNVNSYPTFLLSGKELSDKSIDTSNSVDFIGEAVLTFNFSV